ncbi:MAG: BCCT family transporter, partial [Verrucomicrobiae bacterium]|nr:BCCT family transporter [Verrucomicrobiae bacterium]
VVLIIVITSMATTSVVLGLDTGIRRLSELNIVLAVLLLLFVLIAGPTVFLLQTFVQNTGNYMGSLMESTFNLYAYKPSGWIGGWTLFYWGWWIAWSPFVGMFIARVSRGRTIREFVGGVLLAPVGFTFMWMTVFGDTAIHMVLMDNVKGLTEAVSDNTAVALFKFFENLPFSGVASFLATALVVTFFVTSSDSGSLVVDMLTSGGQEESPVWQRIFWALTEGLIAVVLLLTGGLGALQTAAIATALPFTVALIFICWGMLKALRLDVLKRSIVREARIGPGGSQPDVPWKTRLKSIMHTPQRPAAEGFLANTIRPAFDEICEEFNQRQLPCRIEHGEDRAWIEVRHGDEVDFYYLVQLRRYEPPSFVIRDLKNRRAKALEFYRAEVHLKEGGQNYDIMGWSKDDVIHDVLDHYERHLHFLQLAR